MAVQTVQEVFDKHMPTRLQQKPDVVTKINAKYKFEITGEGGGTWVLDLTAPGGAIIPGSGDANCTVTMAAKDFVDMINGATNAQMAFMTGKLKIQGDMGLALKLGSLLG